MKKDKKGFKRMSIFLSMLLGSMVLTSNINVLGEKSKKVKMPYKEIGSFISASSSSPSESYKAKNAGNNSGMSGSESIIHTHSSEDAENTMWLSKEKDVANSFITYDLGRVFQVGKIFVWNFNSSSSTDNGLRKIELYYSVDKENWKLFKEYELEKSSGEKEIKATNLVDGSIMDLMGTSARYVKLVPKTKEGNWGGKAYGLSEVRFYQFKQEARKNAYIASTIYHPVSTKITEEQYRLVNGLGMSHPSSEKAFHNNNPLHMYLTDKPGYVVFDLMGTYPVGSMSIYNYNESGNTKQGAKDITISTAVEYGKWEKLKDITLKQADGTNRLSPTDKVAFNNKTARFIKVEMKSNHGGDKYGLSAVRFYAGEGSYVEPADEWTGMFSNYNGWSGADGIFSTALDGIESTGFSKRAENTKTFFEFSDTFESTVNPETKQRQKMKMVNNSFGILEGNDPFYGKITYTLGGKVLPIKPSSGRPGYYWLGDTFVSGGKVYNFPLYIETVKEGYGFAQKGEDLASFQLKDGTIDFDSLKVQEDLERKYLSNFQNKSIIFGSAVLVNTKEAGAKSPDGYIYVYGYMDSAGMKRELIAARVKIDKIEDFSSYEYFGSEGWTKDIKKVKGLASNVAPEMSLTMIDSGENQGKYLLVYTYMTNTNRIVCRIGDSPTGPFHEEQELFYITETSRLGTGAFSYNAKGHPAISEEGELLISYNINYSGDLSGHVQNADCYRPRFVRLAKVGEAVADSYDPAKDNGDVDSTKTGNKNKLLSGKGSLGYIITIILLAVANAGTFAYILKRNKKRNNKQ